MVFLALAIPHADALPEIDYHILSSQVPMQGAEAFYEGAYAVGKDVPPGISSEIEAGRIEIK